MYVCMYVCMCAFRVAMFASDIRVVVYVDSSALVSSRDAQ
jgi:hypothetical protein